MYCIESIEILFAISILSVNYNEKNHVAGSAVPSGYEKVDVYQTHRINNT
jgi:ribosomal protein L32E